MKHSIKSFFIKSASRQFYKLAKVDASKRLLLTGFGSLLAACTAPQPEQKKAKKINRPVDYMPGDDDVTPDQSVDCSMCAPGANPPIGGLPGTPPGQTTPPGGINPPGGGAGGTTPSPGTGGSTPTTPGTGGTTPSPGTGVTNPTPGTGDVTAPAPAPANPTLPIQTFSALGPAPNIQSSDMMGGLTQTMSDGTPIIVWGFTGINGGSFNGDSTRLCPGPVIEMVEGRSSSVALISTHPHTIHLHGLDVDQANDGVPSTSGYVARMFPPALTPPGVNLGGLYEYRFVAPHAGTYLYHCHVDTVLHMEMGMSGTIIVRPADGRKDILYTGGPSFNREYIWQLHTFDSSWHTADSAPVSNITTVRYSPDYFMINGRDGADILADTASAITGYAQQQVLIRLVNIGYMPAVVKLGGIPFDVICSDGRPLKSLMLDLVTEWLIAPGERYDIMFTMPQSGVTNATVDYLDIQGRNILGTAISTITTL